MNWGKAGRNAARVVSPPRAQQEERVPPSQDQARQLREAVKGDRLEALFTVTLDPGLRQGGTWARAGLTSTWLVSARLWSRHSLQPVHGQFQLVGPTTARSRRSLDMQQAGPAAYRARKLEERPRVVLEISGHIQTSTTMDIYTHVFPEVRREAATVMAETLAAPARS